MLMNNSLKSIFILMPIATFVAFTLLFSSEPQRIGNPSDSLPSYITHLTWFGERPDWRHDGKRIVFLSKTFGDVYEYDFSNERITACTDHFQHYGFVRVLYLSNGDFLLSGPIENFDRMDEEARQKARDASYLFILDKSLTKPPVPLGIQCNEGPAVSRSRLYIAWTHGNQDSISIGQISYADGVSKLVDVRQILDVNRFPFDARPYRWIETQNFVPPEDVKLTITAYEINNTDDTETYLFDIKTGDLKNVSKNPGYYDECEGIFPDGSSTLVESTEKKGRWPLVDLYRLMLDGSGRKERLTFFTDYKGWKATQGVVSDDGNYMVFQCGKTGTEAGQGFGLFLYDFTKATGKER
jgi:hypothetical protein